MDKKMQKALEEDGEQLHQLTGENYGPFHIAELSAPCPASGDLFKHNDSKPFMAWAQSEVDRLRADFNHYADHKPECRGGDGENCACGYLQAWSRAR